MDIKKIGSLLPAKRTDEQKEDKWNKLIDVRHRYFQKLYKAEKDKDYAKKFMWLCKLEFEGGTCFYCNNPWTQKIIDNDWMYGAYYVPNCDCFPRCPFCGKVHYDLFVKYHEHDLDFCDNCGFMLYDMEKKTTRYGGEYQIFFDNLTRKEQLMVYKKGWSRSGTRKG